jgi:hypothetical protein
LIRNKIGFFHFCRGSFRRRKNRSGLVHCFVVDWLLRRKCDLSFDLPKLLFLKDEDLSSSSTLEQEFNPFPYF